MQSAGDAVAQARHDPNETYYAVVSDLAGLLDHIGKSVQLIEQTTAMETWPGSPESSINVIVLDDISPRYTKGAAAACDVNLGIALRSPIDSGDNDPRATRLPVHSVIAA
ncbi:hypothetical protein [Bradyrhizobium australiense]|uniref:Uncharacterized protein n=1 Tax=Bradyrhizobium australiense TaxID=2721161 RepID=A0A7Y4GY15_9BRAD|nr:hypothetical protein [Bradyrhizobium australiense]NOJ44079.1 hypothetical protein [Bradyrhizobium australiense]